MTSKMLNLAIIILLFAFSMVFAEDMVLVTTVQQINSEDIQVKVLIDMSGIQESLGSYTATLSWDADVLNYKSYTGGNSGFENPVVNENYITEGKLIVAAANPNGANGELTVFNLTLEKTGQLLSSDLVGISFSAMAAAYSFHNLLPFVVVHTDVVNDLDTESVLPHSYDLNLYPNPFNPTTQVYYQIPKAGDVTITIYNTLGQKVRTLVNEYQNVGSYKLRWDARDDLGNQVSAGTYIVSMKSQNFSDSQKLLLVK